MNFPLVKQDQGSSFAGSQHFKSYCIPERVFNSAFNLQKGDGMAKGPTLHDCEEAVGGGGGRNQMLMKISPFPPLTPRLQTLPFLTYLVDSTSKGNPGPLSPAEGHTPLPDLCLVTSRQDLVGQGLQHWPKDSPIPSTSSLCREELEGVKRSRELEENGLEFGVSKPQGIVCNSDHLIPMTTL